MVVINFKRKALVSIFWLMFALKSFSQRTLLEFYERSLCDTLIFDSKSISLRPLVSEKILETGKINDRYKYISKFQRESKNSLIKGGGPPVLNQRDAKWFIGLGIGHTVFVYRFIEPKPVPSGGRTGSLQSLHLDVMYAVSHKWVLESGITLKAIVPPEYISQIGGKPEAGMTIIPFRLNYLMNLSPHEVDLMIFAGYSQGIKAEQFGFGFLSPDIDANGDYYGNVFFPLADIGARIKFSLGRIHLGVCGSYTQGFSDIYRIDVNNMQNVQGEYPRLIQSNGSHFELRLDVYYAIKGK
jgi:hypothetical protein